MKYIIILSVLSTLTACGTVQQVDQRDQVRVMQSVLRGLNK
jgi:hypothetical protein